jgi:cysteine-rich repeat protein
MCGDGVVDWDEECDDGNLDDWDGCSASCESEDMWSFRGSAEGGSIFFIVDGVQLEVITVPGWTAGDVAAAVAAEILANATLLAQGVVVQVNGVGVSTNGTVTGVVVTDPGIDHIGQTLHIPNLPVQGWPWLLLAIGCTGLYAIRRKASA